MSDRSLTFDRLFNKTMELSLNLPRRRPTPRELAGMTPEDRLIAERDLLDLTDAEKLAELEREDQEAYLGIHGEVHPQMILDNEASPEDWGDE
jgi:hypothetical protein